MEAEAFAGGREPAVFVPQLLVEVEALFVEVEELAGDVDACAHVQFAQVADVELGREGRVAGGFGVVRAEAEDVKERVGSAVEEDVVIGHVEVAVEVDPGGVHFEAGGAVGGCGHGLDVRC